MAFKHVCVVPVIQGVVYLVGCIVTYVLAVVVNKDVPPIFPYISDTGAWSLERCIFSFMMGIGALLMLLTLYIRYRQVKEVLLTNKDFKPNLSTINKTAMYLGCGSMLGLFLVGCFQVEPFLAAHVTAAIVAFSLGWLVLLLQTYMSFKIYPALGTKGLNISRAIIFAIVTVALCGAGIFGILSLMLFKGDDVTQWTESSGGYLFHLISVGSEWVLVFGDVLYLALYYSEFKSVVLYMPNLQLIKV